MRSLRTSGSGTAALPQGGSLPPPTLAGCPPGQPVSPIQDGAQRSLLDELHDYRTVSTKDAAQAQAEPARAEPVASASRSAGESLAPIHVNQKSPIAAGSVHDVHNLRDHASPLSVAEAGQILKAALDRLAMRDPTAVSDGSLTGDGRQAALKLRGHAFPLTYEGATICLIVADRADAAIAQTRFEEPVITLREAQVLSQFEIEDVAKLLWLKVNMGVRIQPATIRIEPEPRPQVPAEPSVHCPDCENFSPSPFNPDQGLGGCSDPEKSSRRWSAHDPAPSPFRNKPCVSFRPRMR